VIVLAAERFDACWRCAASRATALMCGDCGAPQPVACDADFFALLGLPRRLAVDPAALEARWYEASRVVHPDRHQTGGARERDLSLEASSALNRAYRTLRAPTSRGRYWLELHGRPLGERNARVPPSLAAEVFETQEKLEALREAPRSTGLRREVAAIRGELADRIGALVAALRERYVAWDAAGPAAPAVLDELRARLSEIAYLRTLAEDVDEALGG